MQFEQLSTTELTFLAAISLDEPLSRMIYADWLDDCGCSERARAWRYLDQNNFQIHQYTSKAQWNGRSFATLREAYHFVEQQVVAAFAAGLIDEANESPS